jgi:oxidoreductase
MSSRISLAVLGAGWVARHGYGPHLREGPFEVVAIHDPDSPAAEAFRLQLRTASAVCVDSVDACLQSGARAVLIATPSPSHVELAVRALRAGRHVLCEKPVAVRASQVRELAEAESSGGGRLAGAAVCRHRADVRRLLGWVAALGEVKELDLAWIRHRGVPSPGSWRTRAGGGMTGALADLGYHLLDLAVAIGGAGRAWTCARARLASGGAAATGAAGWFAGAEGAGLHEVDDRADATLVAGDVRLRVRAAWLDEEPGDVTRLRVACAAGEVELEGLFGLSDQRRVAHQRCTRRAGGLLESASFEPGPSLHVAAFQSVLREFAGVCRGAEPEVGLPQIAATVRMLEAIDFAAEWRT